MGERVEVTRSELELILEALADAAYYRETHARVLQAAVRRRDRRSGAPVESAGASDSEGHRRKARAYGELALKLKQEL